MEMYNALLSQLLIVHVKLIYIIKCTYVSIHASDSFQYTVLSEVRPSCFDYVITSWYSDNQNA